MKKGLKLVLIVVLVLAILAGAITIVIKNLDDDQLIVLESKVRTIKSGDKLFGYVFHSDAIKKMTDKDLEDLIEGVKPVCETGEGGEWEIYRLVSLKCSYCSPESDSEVDGGCVVSINVVKYVSDTEAHTMLVLFHDYVIYAVGEEDGVKYAMNYIDSEDRWLKGDTNVDDYLFYFDQELNLNDSDHATVLTLDYVNNGAKLKKYIGGIFE